MSRWLCFLSIALISAGLCQAQNTNISKGVVFDGEPFMTVNPENPAHLVLAWMGYSFGSPLGIKTIVSFNGGRSWSNPVFLPHLAASYHSADPSLVFDNTGSLFACYVDYRETPDSGGICLVKSADGGLTWKYLSKALDMYADGSKMPVDRPWLTISPVNNHMYITSKPAPWIAPPNRPYFIRSDDQGATWKPWRYIDGTGFLVGNVIKAPMAASAVSSDGTFHCIYPSWVAAQNLLPGYLHAKSSDDGNNFTYNGAGYFSTGIDDTLAKAGGSLAADPANMHHLAFVFLGSGYGDLDVFFIESFNDGATWSSPYRVNNDPAANGKMQDMAWSAFNTRGDFVVAWRDRRNSAGSGYMHASEMWGAMRWKDSTGFSANFRISDTLSGYQDVLGLNGNDFMTLSVVKDTLHAAWGDTRNGILNIWYSRINLRTLKPAGIENIVHEKIPEITIFPNPGNSIFRFTGNRVVEVVVYDLQGKQLFSVESEDSVDHVDLSAMPPGIYVLSLKTPYGNMVARIVRE
ncbi:MAG: T9SS type A sorting domain-containing protein [Bacteroidota bacterium]